MAETETKTTTARHPAALSTEYHKARKQLMLWSAILFIWELVGIDLETAKDEPGNVGAIVKSVKSRQAVPWVLFILVCYFLFKCWIEWAQCHPERRKVSFSRIDFISAWAVALAAVGLYLAQTISHIQIADRIQENPEIFKSVAFGFVEGIIFTPSAIVLISKASKLKPWRVLALPERVSNVLQLVLTSLWLFILGSALWRVSSIIHWGWFFSGFLIVALPVIVLGLKAPRSWIVGRVRTLRQPAPDA